MLRISILLIVAMHSFEPGANACWLTCCKSRSSNQSYAMRVIPDRLKVDVVLDNPDTETFVAIDVYGERVFPDCTSSTICPHARLPAKSKNPVNGYFSVGDELLIFYYPYVGAEVKSFTTRVPAVDRTLNMKTKKWSP